jgi:hypothetical protein
MTICLRIALKQIKKSKNQILKVRVQRANSQSKISRISSQATLKTTPRKRSN